MRAELTHDAAGEKAFPTGNLPEVAVLGRSNVGKSSFINALVGRRGLARTSSTPGKTRRIHFYRIEDRAYLVDLPGYGFAAVGKAERETWRPLVESYLRGSRPTLGGAILLVDLRRGPEVEEHDLRDWLAHEGVPARLVCTKADKLKRSELGRRKQEISRELGLAPDEIACVSAKTGRGLAPVGAWLESWLDLPFRRPDGTPLLPE